MQASGRARFESDIQDLSVLVATGLKGIAAVAGITAWGLFGTSTLVGSWAEYQKNFGGYSASSDFPAMCRIMLDRGVKLRVARIGHFTDITDKTTATASKGTVTRTTVVTAETRSTATATITTVGATADVYTASAGGYSWNYPQAVADTPTLVAAGLVAAIMASTSVHKYTAANVAGVVTISAPVGSGATPNGKTLNFTKTGGTGVIGKTNFAGGIDGIAHAGTLQVDTAYLTDALNGSTVTVSPAANGVAGEIDIAVSIAGMAFLSDTVKNLKRTFTTADKNKFNLQIPYLQIASFSGDIANGTATIAGGTLVLTGINDNDFIGDGTAMTGLHSFDDATDFVRIAVPEKATMVLDNAIQLYATGRNDCRFLLRAPIGVSGNIAIDYREKTGVYAGGTPIDTWRGSMIYGGITVTHPQTGLDFIMPAVCGAIIAASYKDNKAYEWFAAGGAKRGKIISTLGVEYNLASPARSTEFDNVDVHGMNAVVNDPDYGVVYWGNSTLQKADTMLKHENVGDLMIFLSRAIAPLVKGELFDPNDVQTWKAIYRKVKKLMDYVQKNRGVWKYLYQGDQDVDDVSEATVNDSTNIDAGAYIFNLWVAPKAALKYAGMRVVVTNSGVKFEELADQVI